MSTIIAPTLLFLVAACGSTDDAGNNSRGGGSPPPPTPSAVTVGVSGDKFTINNGGKFLLGVSYFDARNWRESDLAGLASRGFNLIRIWADWRDRGFFDASGNLVDANILLALVQSAGGHGLIVDLAILDAEPSFGDSKTKRENAVRGIVTALANEPHVMFDIQNEHTCGPVAISHAEVGRLVGIARTANPNAVITVSSACEELVDYDGSIDGRSVDEELDAGVDLLTPHMPRSTDWHDRTDDRTIALKSYLASIGRNVPIYLQEEQRRGYSSFDPSLNDFLQAVKEALDSGAAGWVFHTEAAFDLASSSFFDNLDSVETDTVDALPAAVGLAPPPS